MVRGARVGAQRAQEPEAVEPRHHHVGQRPGPAVARVTRRERRVAVADRLDARSARASSRRRSRACRRCRRRAGSRARSAVGRRPPRRRRREAPASALRAASAAPPRRTARPRAPSSASARGVPIRSARQVRGGRAAGVTVKVVPRPGSLSTSHGRRRAASTSSCDQREADAGALVGARRGRPRRDGSARTGAAARRRGCRCPCRAPRARRVAGARAARTRISPSNVNLNAFERRLRTIFSHISRST